jgi:hypothetical protein
MIANPFFRHSPSTGLNSNVYTPPADRPTQVADSFFVVAELLNAVQVTNRVIDSLP